MIDPNIPHQDMTYSIIGCAMRVHRRTQKGLREKHYQRAFDAEMLESGITTEMEYPKQIYDGQVWMGILYLDHWVNQCIVVEDKEVQDHTKKQMPNSPYLPTFHPKTRRKIQQISLIGSKGGSGSAADSVTDVTDD